MEQEIIPPELPAAPVKVSVLMPVYNTKEEYLREAIESTLTQTYRDFEFLIINDASTDPNVEQVVKSYDDPRIRYSSKTENTGISAVRNELMSLARGEYLAVMDHDDISLPERFAKEVAYLDAHPEVGLVGCQYTRFPTDCARSTFPLNDEDIRVAMLGACIIHHPACMLRKSVLDASGIRYEAEYSPAEDYGLFCRLLRHTRFHNLNEVLFRYRWHESNTSKVHHRKLVLAADAVRENARSLYPNLYEELNRRGRHVRRIKLFGFFPILKTTTEKEISRSLLFNQIPVYKTVVSGLTCYHYLFGIIPLFSVKKEVYVKSWFVN